MTEGGMIGSSGYIAGRFREQTLASGYAPEDANSPSHHPPAEQPSITRGLGCFRPSFLVGSTVCNRGPFPQIIGNFSQLDNVISVGRRTDVVRSYPVLCDPIRQCHSMMIPDCEKLLAPPGA